MGTVEQRVKAGEKAADAIDVMLELAAELPKTSVNHFWDRIAHQLMARVAGAPYKSLMQPIQRKIRNEISEEQRLHPMNDSEARSFGERLMEFGEHKDKRIADTPIAYLVWLAGAQKEFSHKLERYLASPYVQREIENAMVDFEQQNTAS